MKIKTGDNVIVISGDDTGKKGKVLKAMPKTHQVIVDGVNVHKKHIKPSQANPKGEVKEINSPIDVSKVALVDPKSGKATKVGYKLQGDKKVRFAKSSGVIIK
mgnify:FL=1|jgi:large subunit ribosomal protein L24